MNERENVGSEACNRSSDFDFESLTQSDEGPGPLGMVNAKITGAREQNVRQNLDINWEEPNFHQAPLWRTWEDLSWRHRASATITSEDGLDQHGVSRGFEFSLLCYNILAQRLLEENDFLYAHCLPEALCWKDRLKSLLQEFSYFDADILCLQEVQEDHFEEDLKLFLQERGYGCVYKRRTGDRPDGCAICYKTKRMELVASREVEFFRPCVNVLSKDNVGLVVLLRPLGDPSVEPFCVTNTHLLYNPWRGDIKLAQLALLFAEIQQFLGSQASNLRSTNHLPLILCGDFNSLPFSPLYRFVQDSLLHCNGLFSSKVSGQNKISPLRWHLLPSPLLPPHLGIGPNCCHLEQSGYNGDEGEWFSCKTMEFEGGPSSFREQPDTISHPFHLTSVYSHVNSRTGKLEATIFNSGQGQTVDYIFYSVDLHRESIKRSVQDGRLQLLARLSLPNESDIRDIGGLPNIHCPSDHVSLAARFRLLL
uniref:protein angel homolog 2-like isoform X4 n=1 Tax=Myxine glutinosa TaxID=7769 RepID=UPI00358FDC0D